MEDLKNDVLQTPEISESYSCKLSRKLLYFLIVFLFVIYVLLIVLLSSDFLKWFFVFWKNLSRQKKSIDH